MSQKQVLCCKTILTLAEVQNSSVLNPLEIVNLEIKFQSHFIHDLDSYYHYQRKFICFRTTTKLRTNVSFASLKCITKYVVILLNQVNITSLF